MECAICNKTLNRQEELVIFYAVRIGEIIEQITGKSFVCCECVKRVERGEVKVVALKNESV